MVISSFIKGPPLRLINFIMACQGGGNKSQ